MPRRAIRRPRRNMAKKTRVPKHRRSSKSKASLKVTNQYATLVETKDVGQQFSDQPYQANFCLADFYRATTVAKNFKFYRAKKVKWEYMPYYNTFNASNSVSTVGKPQMYFMMNREQTTSYASLAPVDALFSIQTCGTDPVPMTNNKEIIYKPNWNTQGLSGYTYVTDPASGITVTGVVSMGSKAQYGWIPTPDKDAYLNPNSPVSIQQRVINVAPTPGLHGGVIYCGHNTYIAQENEPNIPVCRVIVTVEWEFKGGKQLYAPPITAPVNSTEQTLPVKE